MLNNDKFLAPKGDYKNLIAFQKTECIYDITLYFVEHYLPKIGDRTVDQMVQAACQHCAGVDSSGRFPVEAAAGETQARFPGERRHQGTDVCRPPQLARRAWDGVP